MLRIGCSGWMYRHWRELFYPRGVPQSRWLEHYAQHFDTVEINNTFYHLPEAKTFESWRERAPAGFRYAMKGSQFITHRKRLREPDEAIERLADRLKLLGDRAGPVLWQLPASFRRDDARLSDFLEALPDKWQYALEFRHQSWLVEPVYDLLRRHGAALCVADSSGRWPTAVELTTDWTYLRFHGGPDDGNYPPKALKPWAERLRRWRARGIDAWVYFNNDWQGFAIKNAQHLRERLDVRAPGD